MHRLALAALTLALVSAPAAAYADSFTTATFNTGPFSTSGTTVQYVGVAGFNPALGTLDSITIAFSGSYTITGANNLHPSLAQFSLGNGAISVATPAYVESSNGTYTASATVTDTLASALAAFTNANVFALGFQVVAAGSPTVTNATPNGFAGTLTYDYTPAAPVAVTPEPSSLALLGTRILGVVGVMRKRLA